MESIYMRFVVVFVVTLDIFSYKESWFVEGVPRIINYEFTPKRQHFEKRDEEIQYKTVRISEPVDANCRDTGSQVTWLMSSTMTHVPSLFYAEPKNAGEYVCRNKKFHLLVTTPLRFAVLSGVTSDRPTRLWCGAVVYTGFNKSFLLDLSIRNYEGNLLANKQLYTSGFAMGINIRMNSSKTQEDILTFSSDASSFICTLNIFEPANNTQIYKTQERVMIKLYQPLTNVRPNTTKTTVGQPVQCLSKSIPPAHRYAWKWTSTATADPKFEKPQYITSDSILKIYHEGNYTFICTAFNLVGRREYSSSWVGNLLVASEPGKKVEARSVRFDSRIVAGGSFATVVVLVVVVSYARG